MKNRAKRLLAIIMAASMMSGQSGLTALAEAEVAQEVVEETQGLSAEPVTEVPTETPTEVPAPETEAPTEAPAPETEAPTEKPADSVIEEDPTEAPTATEPVTEKVTEKTTEKETEKKTDTFTWSKDGVNVTVKLSGKDELPVSTKLSV